MRVVAVCAVLAFSFLRPAAFADTGSASGIITVEITDAAKRGVAGVVVSAKVDGTEVKATTGLEQASDAELVAAARQGQKAVDQLNSKYNARAVLAGVPLGAVSITLVDVKGAKLISAMLSSDQPTWKLTATVDGKAKKLVGAAKIVFDEVANARAQTDAAKAEATKAKAAAEAAKQEQEKARQAQEAARQEQEHAKAKQTQAGADAKRAQDVAEAERLKRARSEAPSKITVFGSGCRCSANKTIVVSCNVKSAAEVAVDIQIAASAETGTWKINSSGKLLLTGVTPGQITVQEVTTSFSGMKNCSSCTSSICNASSVVPK